MKRIKMMCFLLALLGLLSACSAHSVDAEEQSAPTWQSRYDLGVRYLSDGRYEEYFPQMRSTNGSGTKKQ